MAQEKHNPWESGLKERQAKEAKEKAEKEAKEEREREEALAAARAEADSWTAVLQHLVDANAALRKRLGAQDDDDDSNDDDLGEYSQLDDVSRVPVNVAME